MVTQPLVNILRSAVSILVAIVSHPHNRTSQPASAVFGFRALKPAVAVYPQFLQMLVSMLSSAEHLLCANALQLINSLVRDAVTNDTETEWPKFIKKLQDLGVIKAVYVLMQSSAVQDLAHPILEFQSLTKVMLRKWREVRVDIDKPDHKRALRSISAASYVDSDSSSSRTGSIGSKRIKDPERWRRVGFSSEMPGREFEETGFLGMMDLTDYVVGNEDQFRKLVLEQSNKPPDFRCAIAKASLATTLVLYEHFEIDKGESDDTQRYAIVESRPNFDMAFKPLLLHWSRLHTAGLNAFLRLWKATGAEAKDFDRIADLVRILIDQVVGQASRTKDISEAEDELADFDYHHLRELQMERLGYAYEEAWGHHLRYVYSAPTNHSRLYLSILTSNSRQVRDELNNEALTFVKEQRIRCLLAGTWFPHTTGHGPESGPVTKQTVNRAPASNWRFVKLSHNRRYLHYADFDTKKEPQPTLDELADKIDLNIVSSVVSNVSASPPTTASSSSTIRNAPGSLRSPSMTTTKITIHGYVSASTPNKESVLLQLQPQTHTLASEWLDGLLMLLNQQPITADTNKLATLIASYGLKIRLLNLRFEDVEAEDPHLPTREGLDDDYWYDIGGMEVGA